MENRCIDTERATDDNDAGDVTGQTRDQGENRDTPPDADGDVCRVDEVLVRDVLRRLPLEYVVYACRAASERWADLVEHDHELCEEWARRATAIDEPRPCVGARLGVWPPDFESAFGAALPASALPIDRAAAHVRSAYARWDCETVLRSWRCAYRASSASLERYWRTVPDRESVDARHMLVTLLEAREQVLDRIIADQNDAALENAMRQYVPPPPSASPFGVDAGASTPGAAVP